ncbi:hypothetical protein VTN00DRAFT_1886 [Thermoascus crustaceus]|uniref:uncharacterized protein n=1 Tax=Thermoascus crustaceus TaxID=5088 RepID=UPI0037448BD5
MTKVAVITGGASGMGLAVAKALAESGGWNVHLLDINEERGIQAAKELPNASFHKTDVNQYSSLATTFKTIFIDSGRLDFVFANAGVIERKNFYARHPEGADPPPEPDQLSIDVDLKGVISTSYLALHYFRQSPGKGQGASLVMTASCGGLYPSYYSPLYSAAKHGVVAFMRSIASHFRLDGIRVNAICPTIVQTNLLHKAGWANFPQYLFIPAESIEKVVLLLIDGQDMVDANGKEVPAAETYGRAVEMSGANYYFREQPEYCDDEMRQVMTATVLENQVGGVLTS